MSDLNAETWKRYAAEASPVTQIYLNQAERITVRVSLPASGGLQEVLQRYFDAEGILTGAPTQALPAPDPGRTGGEQAPAP